MKVRGAKLTAWIGASGMRERRPVAVDFVIKDGRLRPTSLPIEALQLLGHSPITPTEVRKLFKPSVVKKVLRSVEVDITKGLSEEHPSSSTPSKERELRVGSQVELYIVMSDQRHHLLKGFVTRVETIVFLR